MNKWKCTRCKKRIKKGVLDRVNELATYENPKHPPHRPPYLHLIPLTEIIKNALGHSSTETRKVKEAWETLVLTFGSEVTVLVDAEMERIQGATDERIKDSIAAFREGRVFLHPGGGGRYGSIEILDIAAFARLKNAAKKQKEGQTSLSEY